MGNLGRHGRFGASTGVLGVILLILEGSPLRHMLCLPIDYRESFQDVKMLEDETKAIQSAQSPQLSVDYNDPFAVAEGKNKTKQKKTNSLKKSDKHIK